MTTDTYTFSLDGETVEIAYTILPTGLVRLNCLAYLHESKRQEELEDLLPCWHARQDIKDRIMQMEAYRD